MDESNYDETRFQEICGELQPILDLLGYRNPPIVPLSALKGENVFEKSEKMPWYKGSSLIETLDTTVHRAAPPVDKPLRACVQDVYEIEGKKIVVSKILAGVLEEGKIVKFQPSREKGPVAKIEIFGKRVEKAGPGDSVGLIVNNLSEAKRGEVISYLENGAKVVRSFVAEMILFSNIEVRNNDLLIIRCGTAENKCKIQRILERMDPVNLTVNAEFPDVLGSGEIGKLILSPIEPMCIEKYSEFPELGRFVVAGSKGTVAAGIVLETEITEQG